VWKALGVVVVGGALSVAGFVGFLAAVQGRGPGQATSVDGQLVQTARLAQQVATAPTAVRRAGAPAAAAPTGVPVVPAPRPSAPTPPPSTQTAVETPTAVELLRPFVYCAPGTTTPPPPAAGSYDAVFALGAGVLQQPDAPVATLVGDDARTRVVAAYLAVARFGAARVLGFSGGHSDGEAAPSEAASYRRFLDSPVFAKAYGRAATGKAAEVVLEERSKTTFENLAEIAKLASLRGWRRLLLVTSHYHVPRVRVLVAERKLAGADVAAAEPLVEAGLGDSALHAAYCAYYRSPPGQLAVEREAAILVQLQRSGAR
jgi:uncharacterized SAM-binding protein YcdF (DUF218 family)